MTLSKILDELFRILPSKDIGTPAVAEELEIWERELADLPLDLIDRAARAFMRGDRGEQKDGKFWRPTLPAFRQAVVRLRGTTKPQYPMLTDQTCVIPDDERRRIAAGFDALKKEFRSGDRGIVPPAGWNSAGQLVADALVDPKGAEKEAQEWLDSYDKTKPLPKLSDEAKARLSLNERHAG